MNCSSCKFMNTEHISYNENHPLGKQQYTAHTCHRFPKPNHNGWYSVQPNDWCGEFIYRDLSDQ